MPEEADAAPAQDTPPRESQETPPQQQEVNWEEQVAWAAGLFEGEGCIHLDCTKTGSYTRLTLVTTDRDVAERFARIVGVGHIYGKKPKLPTHKPQWQWRVAARGDVLRVKRLLLPHLGLRRTERWRECDELASPPFWPTTAARLKEQYA